MQGAWSIRTHARHNGVDKLDAQGRAAPDKVVDHKSHKPPTGGLSSGYRSLQGLRIAFGSRGSHPIAVLPDPSVMSLKLK